MGEPDIGNTISTNNEFIVILEQPSELKHLSNWRKRKKNRFS